jgi:hypothetical protein
VKRLPAALRWALYPPPPSPARAGRCPGNFRGTAVEGLGVVDLDQVRLQAVIFGGLEGRGDERSWKRCDRWMRATALRNAVGFVVGVS